MIDLLPAQEKQIIRRELIRRFLLVFGFAFSFLVLIFITFALGVFIFQGLANESLEEQLVTSKDLAERKNLEELEQRAETMNIILAYFNDNEKRSRAVSGDVFKILNLKSEGIKIESFLFDFFGPQAKKENKKRVLVRGVALTRDGLLDFIAKIREDGHFKEVVSPPSNLLTEKDVSFSLSLIMKQ